MGDVDDESYSSSYCGKSLFKYHNLLGFETKTIVELLWLKLTILVFCPETIADQSFDGYCQEIVVDAMEVDIDEEVEMELTLEPAEMMEIDEDEDVEMAIFEYDEDIEMAMEMGFDMSGESVPMEIEYNLGELTFSLVDVTCSITDLVSSLW